MWGKNNTSNMSILVVLVGNIGTGKSTFCNSPKNRDKCIVKPKPRGQNGRKGDVAEKSVKLIIDHPESQIQEMYYK